MQQKTQHQYPDPRSLTPHHVSSQHATTKGKIQSQEPLEGTSMLLSLAKASQQVSRTTQIIIGMVAALIVIGTFALLILAAVVPNAYIGITALLTSLGGFLGGLFAGKVAKKYC